MSIWNEEKTKVYVNSAACMEWWEASSGLTGAVMEPILTAGLDLSDSIKSVCLNSPYCVWHHLARKNNKTANLGETVGTDLSAGLSKTYVENYVRSKVTDFKSLESYGVNAFLPLANAYNTLLEEYSFNYTSGVHVTGTPSNSNIQNQTKEYIGTIQYQGDTLYVTTVGFDNSTDKQCFIYAYSVEQRPYTYVPTYGPPVISTYNYFTKIKIPIALQWTQDQFLYVSYYDTNDVRKVYAESITGNGELQEAYKEKRDLQYPTFVARKDGKSIVLQNKGLFDETVKATKRLRLDWDTMAPQLNGDLSSIKKPTEKDKKYAEDLTTNCKCIYTTLAVDVTANSPYVKEYLFRLFKTVYFKNTGFILSPNKKGGELNYSCQGYHHYITYENISYTKHIGKVCRAKSYACKSTKTDRLINQSMGQYSFQRQITDTHLCIYHQIDKDTYYEIIVDNPVHYTDAFDQDKKTSLPKFDNMKDFTKAEIRKILQEREGEDIEDDEDNPLEDPTEFIVPLYPVVVKQMGAVRGGVILQLGLRNVWETKIKIKKKWWQSTIFTVIRYIVYVIYIVVSAIYRGGPVGIAAALKEISILEVLFQLLMTLVIKIAIKIICKIFKLDPAVEGVLNAIVDTVRMVYAIDAGASSAIATSIGINAGTMIVNKDFSFEAFANVLGGIATAQLGSDIATSLRAADYTAKAAITIGASASTAFTLATSPSFYQALNQKKFTEAVLQGVFAIASSYIMVSGAIESSTITSESLKMGNNPFTPNNLSNISLGEVVKNNIASALQNIGNTNMYNIQKRTNALNKSLSDLVKKNANLERAERILTAHNNDTVLKMLVNQEYCRSITQIGRTSSLV